MIPSLTGSNFQVAPATVNDFPIAADLQAAMTREFGGDRDSTYPGWRERFVQYFLQRQDKGQAQLFCAQLAGNVVGITVVTLIDDYHGYVRGTKSACISAVYVLPAYRRKGIARRLTQEALDWARTKGCLDVRLKASNEAVSLYQSLGFKPLPVMKCSLR